jgi:1-acyl-sn-glycerol-3-phosphate acyltransferase
VRPGTPYLLVSNHQSLYDIAMMGGLMLTNYPKYVAKKELAFGIPSVSYHLKHGGNAIIDRSNRGQALVAIRALGEQAVARGVSAVIYPEGTRARDGVLKPFKRAGMHELLAAAPELPVVPIAIDGSWKLVERRLGPIPFGTRVEVAILDPIGRAPDEDREALIDRVEATIRRRIEAWRGPAPG